MKANLISQYEASFMSSGTDSEGKKHILKPRSIAIPGSGGSLNYTQCTLANNNESFFYKQEFSKNQIVLHFTAGYLKGDIGTLTKDNYHVSVPFVLGRDGVIFNLWSSKFWSYHLGPGAIGGNTEMSKKTIAIEISNIGYLKKINDYLVSSYNNTDIYCMLSETEYYTHIQDEFRGHQYFASFTDQQYSSIISLLQYLTDKYNIPKSFLPEDKRYEVLTQAEATTFKGITSHVNYRASGKWDIGPAFDWERVMNGLK